MDHFFDENNCGPLWTTLDNFVDESQNLLIMFCAEPVFSDDKSRTILDNFGQLWTSLQILIKSQKLSSMTTTLPANSNQLFVGVGENVNYQLTINYLLLTINYQLINY